VLRRISTEPTPAKPLADCLLSRPTLAELGAAQAGPLTAFQRAEAELLRSRVSFFLSYGSDAPPQVLKAAAQLMPLDPARARKTYLEALIAALLATGRWCGRGGSGRRACRWTTLIPSARTSRRPATPTAGNGASRGPAPRH
jgi:hypothetical protein